MLSNTINNITHHEVTTLGDLERLLSHIERWDSEIARRGHDLPLRFVECPQNVQNRAIQEGVVTPRNVHLRDSARDQARELDSLRLANAAND